MTKVITTKAYDIDLHSSWIKNLEGRLARDTGCVTQVCEMRRVRVRLEEHKQDLIIAEARND